MALEATLVNAVAMFVMWALLTQLYKPNEGYFILESIVVGVATGDFFLRQLITLRDSILTPLQGGEMFYILPLAFGLLYFFIFSRKYRAIYRFTVITTLLPQMAIGMTAFMNVMLTWAFHNASLGSMGDIVIVVGTFFVITYFLYGEKVSRYLSIPRTIGLIFLYCFVAGIIPASWEGFYTGIVSLAIDSAGPLVIIPVIIGLLVLVDAAVGWKKIFGMKTEAEAVATA
jgi:hypothetical protein